MDNEQIRKNFEEKLVCLTEQIRVLEHRFSLISGLRIISFLAGAALMIVGAADRILAAGIAGGIFLLFFIFLIKRHSTVERMTRVADSKKKVTERYLKRFGDEWHSFEDDGGSFLEDGDTVASDVDLLGTDSLYQMISVCHTENGRRMLAETMKLPFRNREETERRREAVRELIGQREFATNFEAAGLRLLNRKKSFNTEEFERSAADIEQGGLPIWASVTGIIFPVIECALLVLSIAGFVSYGYPLAGFLIVLAFSWLTRSVTERVIRPLYELGYSMEDYMDLLQTVEETEFETTELKTVKEELCGSRGVMPALRALNKLSQAYNISFNPLLHQVLNGFLLWDYQLARAVFTWKKKYGKNVSGCFKKIGYIEELLSLAVLGVVRRIGWADIRFEENEGCRLECEDIYHPLIAPQNVKANSVTLGAGITIITGSNMSGKTTFLRTLAINLALAYMGAPVCGKHLSADYMRLFTSMRITDDVAHGISTFYAEILRIKTMAEYRKTGKPMLCLIDEIFKGTNSADRIVGARHVIRGLSGNRCMTLVSTHDFELCDITDEKGNAAVNYHFEEYYDNDQLKFDYKIKHGRCTTTNARAILRMAGFQVAD